MKLRIATPENICTAHSDFHSGRVYHIENARLLKGIYIEKNGFIPTISLHEFANNKNWFAKRHNTYGANIGDRSENDFLINSKNIIIYQRPIIKSEPIENPVLIFQYMWDFNYYHFLTSALPRLSCVKPLLAKHQDLVILVRSDTPQYQLDFLQSFNKVQIKFIDPEKVYDLKCCYIMGFMTNNAAALSGFYEDMHFDSMKIERIFISRKDAAAKRPIKNEDAAFDVAKKKGFHLLELSNIPLFQKAGLFRGASQVICTMGAASANILFSQNGAKWVYVNHPVYKVPLIVREIAKHKNIELHCIDLFSAKWVVLRIFYKIRMILGQRFHEWPNSYYWTIPVGKLKKVLKK